MADSLLPEPDEADLTRLIQALLADAAHQNNPLRASLAQLLDFNLEHQSQLARLIDRKSTRLNSSHS